MFLIVILYIFKLIKLIKLYHNNSRIIKIIIKKNILTILNFFIKKNKIKSTVPHGK
jgi:hypothetical protein